MTWKLNFYQLSNYCYYWGEKMQMKKFKHREKSGNYQHLKKWIFQTTAIGMLQGNGRRICSWKISNGMKFYELKYIVKN